MILTARFVRRARRSWHCDWCEKVIAGPHIYLYGMPDAIYSPSAMRLHVHCCPNDNVDPKVAAALAAAALKESEASP